MTEELRHSEGPWTAYDFGGDWFISCKSYDAGPIMACSFGVYHTREGNARLAAAAPDMLEALQAFVTSAADEASLVRQARAAIAKATTVGGGKG